MDGYCRNCGRPIRVIIFRGGEYCSENCRKALEAAMNLPIHIYRLHDNEPICQTPSMVGEVRLDPEFDSPNCVACYATLEKWQEFYEES